MRPILILCSFVIAALCFAPSCQAGGVFVGRGLFGPRVAVVNNGNNFHRNNNAVVVNRGFNNFGHNRVIVGNGFHGFHGHNNAAVFVNPGFNSFGLGYGGFNSFNGFAQPQFFGGGFNSFGGGCVGGSCGNLLFVH